MTIGSIEKLNESDYKIEVDWKIEDFLPYLKTDAAETSPVFTWSSINWELKISYNSAEEISLFLYKHPSQSKFQVMYKFGIRLIDKTVEERCHLIRSFPYTAEEFGTLEFILKSELLKRKNKLLAGGVLTISCSMITWDSAIDLHNVKYKCLDVLSSNLKTLYLSNANNDVTLILGEQKYPAHKAILTARSTVFAAMFQHDMKEKTTHIVDISDCEADAFKEFLLFLYTGVVENFSNICQVYKLADKYNVQDLKTLCLDYMRTNVSVANFSAFALLAHQYSELELISTMQIFFNRNALRIVSENDWEQFIKQNFSAANQFLLNILKNIPNEI